MSNEQQTEPFDNERDAIIHQFRTEKAVEQVAPVPGEIVTVEIGSIPPGSNPFNYDAFHMGSSLGPGWMAMYSNSGKEMQYLYLVNTNSGRRFRVDLRGVCAMQEVAEEDQG